MTRAAPSPTLLWFRLDLRLSDHPALARAIAGGGPVIPIFIWSPDEEAHAGPGAASRWWLHHSLTALQARLRDVGSRLVIREGPILPAVCKLVDETGADAIVMTRRHEESWRALDDDVTEAMRGRGKATHIVPGSLLFEPDELHSRAGGPFRVFTPFWKAGLARGVSHRPIAAPDAIPAPSTWPTSLPIEALNLLPHIAWDAGLRRTFTPGEAAARLRLQRFLRSDRGADGSPVGIDGYASGRDLPGVDGTSQLSPHLHFGEISVAEVWDAVDADGGASSEHRTTFRKELFWREFAHHLLHHFPHTVTEPLRESFRAFPWADAPGHLSAWQRGETGYPLVDAGMRQLWQIGWMHNRVRMVVASFLTKHLLLPWRSGAAWFWDTLCDADLANNTLGWQWVAGSGADAAPYFRIFHPVAQGERFDARGAYVRRWLPELARLPDRWIHAPWTAPSQVLAEAGIKLDKTYPAPIIDHSWARQRALSAYASISAAARDANAAAKQRGPARQPR